MNVRYAVISGFLGRVADRFTQYHPHRTLAERFELASQIEGLDGFELVYPSDFEDLEGVRSLLEEYGFGVSAVNLNVKRDPKWRYGSFTAKDPVIRADAVRDMKAAMDLAADLRVDKVTCCPLIDGHDYVFQMDYGQAWRWFVRSIREAARHRSDIRISMEYKMSEPRVRTILPNVGRALYLCDQVGLPNVGVTLDIGHAIQAGENPAESLALLAEGGIPVYIHTNDNPGDWDWDMLPASVHLWEWLELFYYLQEMDYQGWMAMDIMPKQMEPLATFEAAIQILEGLEELAGRMDRERVEELRARGSPAEVHAYLMELVR